MSSSSSTKKDKAQSVIFKKDSGGHLKKTPPPSPFQKGRTLNMLFCNSWPKVGLICVRADNI